ncbi:MAG: hypothetical protein LBM28_04110 [Oscillospiraceae bacterium]|jgi:hypothetical protein|nr:hypothetical protein [Oscillospiraceae bacterium]
MKTTYFLGACSPAGFSSYYSSLLTELDQLHIIKGGSGCGKSTFMKKLGAAALANGLDVSYILCSSDPASLDGVVFPQLSLGFVDGTAPHVLEPSLCGGGMNYVNFGEFYDSEAMRPHEPEIRAAQKKNAEQYPYITACLAAADKLLDVVRAEAAAHAEEIDALAQCLIISQLHAVGQKGKLIKRFMNAVTPDGLTSCSESANALCPKVYVLQDSYQLAPQLLLTLQEKALSLGHDCVAGYSPLLPDGKPSHLLIPSAGVGFVSASNDFPFDGESFCKIDLDSTLSAQTRKDLSFYVDSVSSLLQQSVAHMHEAKRVHDEIEALCHPYVDFAAVDRLTVLTIAQLFS